MLDVASGTVVPLADMGGDADTLGSVITFSPDGDQILFVRRDATDATSLWSVTPMAPIPPTSAWVRLGRLADADPDALRHGDVEWLTTADASVISQIVSRAAVGSSR